MQDYYEVLCISEKATDEEIKTSYRNLAQMYHPDKYVNNPLAHLAEEQMKKINEAYEILGNSSKRHNYDLQLSKHRSKQSEDSYTHKPDYSYVTCAEHPEATATSTCIFCNKPLCMRCATQFNIQACPDCLLEYNKNFIASLRRPLIGTAVAAVVGLVLFASNGAAFGGLILGIIVYWGWKELAHAFEIGFFASLLSGVFGILITLPIALIYGFFMGAIKALINVPILAFKYSRESKRANEAEKYILSLKTA